MQNITKKIRDFPKWQRQILKRHYGDDSTGLFFATTLAFILLSCAATMAILDVYFLSISAKYFSTKTKIAMFPFFIIPVISFLFAYWLLLRGHYKIARNIFATITIIAIIGTILLTGGFFGSIATPFLVVVPVMIFLLYGMRAGAYITVAVPVYIILQTVVLSAFKWKIPDYTSLANPDLNVITTNLALYLLVIAMIASYEFQRASLKKNLDKERQKLAEWANRDPLTNLSNSRHFYAQLNDSFQQAKNTGKRLVIMYLDLNRFKSVNDNFGHQTGDLALMEVAKRIEKCVGDNGLVARMGGDEFIILLNDSITDDDITQLQAKLYIDIKKPMEIEGVEHVLGTSIGQSIFPDNCATVPELLKTADEAMYQNKKQNAFDNVGVELNALPHISTQKSA